MIMPLDLNKKTTEATTINCLRIACISPRRRDTLYWEFVNYVPDPDPYPKQATNGIQIGPINSKPLIHL